MSVSGIQGQLLEVTRISVLSGNKLKNTEWISRQDPYVCVDYGSTKCRTRVCTDGGRNPTFPEKFVLTLIEGLRELTVVVWNSNNTTTYDDFIGSGKHTGEVRLIMQYTSATANPYTSMQCNIIHADDFTANTRNWSIKVEVLEKHGAQYSQETNILYQKVVMADETDTIIEGMIYGRQAVNHFASLLREGKTYMITNAQLKTQQISRESSLSFSPFFWALHTSTTVEPLDTPSATSQSYNPRFSTFTELLDQH